ncbi:hypothetical protein QF021_003631 [Acidovorax delafieldii]|uniref:hypothetical protein n=1 Tax=Acidovorax delafieldii TaxID=47920 RepID=UPI002860B2A9|nr:hypothetical protein [Acidovorax delafieldii]MDR6155542.1 hypothetical protein [Acidovorax delafieldii]
MNNMYFDEATQTYYGTAELYGWSGEEHGQIFTGFNKPLQVTPEWIVQSYKHVFANYWQDQPLNVGSWETLAAKPWCFIEQHQNLLLQPTDGALEQLIQAMAGFSPAPPQGVGDLAAGWYSYAQMLGADAGS